jgi:hypothetical protein
VRLFSLPESQELKDVASELHRERVVWREVWSDPGQANNNSSMHSRSPYWAEVSLELGRLARANFPTLTPEEYAATCLLWALRLFRVVSLSDIARLRLLVWMSQLNELLIRTK